MKVITLAMAGMMLIGLFFQCGSPETPEPPGLVTPSGEEAAPTATALPKPTPTEIPVEEPTILEFSGHGNEATQLFQLEAGLLRCDYTHQGDSNFIVTLLDSSGETIAFLANEIGTAEVSSAHSVRDPGDYLMDIMADGDWMMVLTQ